MSSKIEKYQNKLKPRHFDYKTKLFHGSQISSLFFAKTCLGKNVLQTYTLQKGDLFWYFHLGILILGVLFLAKITIGSCCLGWYIALESNLQKSPSLSWHLLGSVTLHLAALENSCYQSQRPNCKKYINPREMSGRTKLLALKIELFGHFTVM